MTVTKICPFMSAPIQTGGHDTSGYSIPATTVMAFTPCQYEKCMLWSRGVLRLRDYNPNSCSGCSVDHPDKMCTEWVSGVCPEHEPAGCRMTPPVRQ